MSSEALETELAILRKIQDGAALGGSSALLEQHLCPFLEDLQRRQRTSEASPGQLIARPTENQVGQNQVQWSYSRRQVIRTGKRR